MKQDLTSITILNVGTTHVRILRMPRTGKAEDDLQYNTHDFKPEMIPPGPVAAASVVPEVTRKINEVRGDVFWITPKTPGGAKLTLADASQLGADRVANLAMLARMKCPAMTLDCGTAVNCEIIDEGGTYLGGAIYPGRLLLRKSLNLFTAQLPIIPFFDELPPFPGMSTFDDMRWGIDGLLIAGLRDFVHHFRERFPGMESRIIACGGDRKFLLDHIDGVEDGGDDFTERGILTLYERNLQS